MGDKEVLEATWLHASAEWPSLCKSIEKIIDRDGERDIDYYIGVRNVLEAMQKIWPELFRKNNKRGFLYTLMISYAQNQIKELNDKSEYENRG